MNENKYIVKGPRRHGKWDYFMGFHTDGTSIITLEREKANQLSDNEANAIIALLSGPYKIYEKELFK